MTEHTIKNIENTTPSTTEVLIEEEQIVEKSSPSFFKRTQTFIMMVAAIMISSGQFNDTKDLFVSLYEITLTNFTHNLEYDLISKIHVGNSMSYVKSIVGESHVIKRSKINKQVTFHYYSKNKYTLTLISEGERLAGYSIFTSKDGFAPTVPFSEELGSKSLVEAEEKTGVYSFDVGNLLYFIESKELGKKQMFLTLVRGFVEYGAMAQEIEEKDVYKKNIKKLIESLDETSTFAESDEELAPIIDKIRANVYPNFYAVTELGPMFIAEALLTRYEFQMYTKS